ncbi:MAG: cytochrome c biogenesis protein CcdA [Erysipelotrichaceae bacterium]
MDQFNINYLLVFMEGLLSFFAPCILPILPLYISYLSGNAKEVDQGGKITYQRHKVFLHTLFFVLGIASTFFLLGFSFSAVGSFIKGNHLWLSRIGGCLIILFGLVQLDVIKLSFLKKEYRIQHHFPLEKMNYFIAYMMGLVFSFSWTPCVGPMLSSVLIMAGNSGNTILGISLVLLYTLGFILPFLGLALFTSEVLNLCKKYQKALQMSIKIGGIVLILIGANMIFEPMKPQNEAKPSETIENKKQAPDIMWEDQEGKAYHVKMDKGKTVLIFFWAEWCGYCKDELATIQTLYEEYGYNEKTVSIISVVQPEPKYSKKAYVAYMKKHKYTFPLYFDDGSGFAAYEITSFPTIFMIQDTGNVMGYISGALPKANLIEIIKQTQNEKK